MLTKVRLTSCYFIVRNNTACLSIQGFPPFIVRSDLFHAQDAKRVSNKMLASTVNNAETLQVEDIKELFGK